RAGVAVVLDPGLAPGAKAPGRNRGPGAPSTADGSPLPLVLTAGRQVKRLSVADFPEPATVLDRVRIPPAFSARSPRARRDLAATVRTKLAGADRWETGQRAGRDSARAGRDQPPPGQAEITRLRGRLRQHPCHSCSDREAHARQAERYARLEREVQQLEEAVAGRSPVYTRVV